MQPWDGLQAYAFPPFGLLHREDPAVSGAGAHVGGSLLASAPVVSGSSGASGGCPNVPSMSEGSTQTAPLPLFSPEPPCASFDCVSYIERFARSFGFSGFQGPPSPVACYNPSPVACDLFATALNHRLPVYFSPMDDPQSAGVDAMMQLWDGLQAYALWSPGSAHSPLW